MADISYSTANNQFSRVASNLEKMGAYFTDVEHCLSLSKYLDFSEAEEVCCLEPSIGDGSAILATTSGGKEKCKIFGVELNDSTFDTIKDVPDFTEVLKADFLKDVVIKNGAFSFMFGNPPYMENTEAKERMELSFIKKAYNYLSKDAVIVWVIPHRVFADEKYARFMYSRFETFKVLKFRPSEYAKWGQIAFIGRKKTPYFNKFEFEEYMRTYGLIENIEELPVNYDGEQIKVYSSYEKDVFPFHAKEFEPLAVLDYLDRGNSASDSSRNIAELLSLPQFTMEDVGKPIIPLKKDLTVLLSVCGIGQGKVGEEGVDLHLQRGTAEVVENVVTEKNEKGDWVDKVTTSTQITMCVIQQDGKISYLV